MVKDRFGRIQVTAAVSVFVGHLTDAGLVVLEGSIAAWAARWAAAGFTTSILFAGGAKKRRFMFVRAANSFSSISLSLLSSLKRFRRRRRLPLTNMSKAAGWRAQ